MVKDYTKKEAIRIVSESANDYANNLVNKNFIIIYRNRTNSKLEYFETVFLPRNFQHLTGLEFVDDKGNVLKQAGNFYRKCLNHALSEKEIRYKDDGTTNMKLAALPKVVNFFKTSKMTTSLNTYQPLLQVDRLVGNISYCLGFTKDGKYYVPSSCLLKDIRDFSDSTSQIVAVLSKPSNKTANTYRELKYSAKGIDLNKLSIPTSLRDLMDI